MNSHNLDKSEKKKYSYGKLLIMVAIGVGVANPTIEQTLQSHSISAFTALLLTGSRAILDGALLYLFVMWIADLVTRKHGGIDDPRNKKVKKVINIIAVAALFVSILSFLFVVASGSDTASDEVPSANQQVQQINTTLGKETAKREVVPTTSPTITSINKATVNVTPEPTIPVYVEKYRPQVIGSHFEIYDQNGNVQCDLINPVEPRSEVIILADAIYKCVTGQTMSADENAFWDEQFASNTNITTRARLANAMWDYYHKK